MLTTLILKNVEKARKLLKILPRCSCFPKISGFKMSDDEARIVIPDLEKHTMKMSDDEFIRLTKTLYTCALQGVTFGPMDEERVFLQNGKTVLIPCFDAKPRILDGRIENPDSFFATLQSLSTIFKSSSRVAMNVHRKKLDGILSLMEELNLRVPSSREFLPSLGVWRHDKFVEKLAQEEENVFVPMIDGRLFARLLPFGKVFVSLAKIKEEIFKGKRWGDAFDDFEEISDADVTALALFFPVKSEEKYVFVSRTVEMHAFCHEFRALHSQAKVIEILEPYFKMEEGHVRVPPKISEEEFDWFLKTFFGKDVCYEGNVMELFKQTRGELFGLSDLIKNGAWRFEKGMWKVEPVRYSIPSPVSLVCKARKFLRNGIKPNLGLCLVETAENISGKELEIFESLKAFFYKILGEYDEMKFYLERANAFGKRVFRNAYYSIVLVMNNMDFSFPRTGKNPLVSVMKKYVYFVEKGAKDVHAMYENVITPLEKFNTVFSKRIECMARNYMAMLLMMDGNAEESLDEFETSLSISKEYDFRDLEPLIELNISSLLLGKSQDSYAKALSALKHSIEEGLRNVISASYLILAENTMENGDFQKVKIFSDWALRVSSRYKDDIMFLKAKMKVENLERDFSCIEEESKEELDFILSLYKDDEEKVKTMLKHPFSVRLKNIKNFLDEPEHEETDDYLELYFLARENTMRNVHLIRRMGRNIYLNDLNIRKIFYEEQLAVVYRQKGLTKSSEYHMYLAYSLAKRFGLEKRALHLKEKINETFLTESHELMNFYLFFRAFRSVDDVLRSFSKEIAIRLGVNVMCEMKGVENRTFCANSLSVWKCDDHPDRAFEWILGEEIFTYSYRLQKCEILLGFKTKNVDMDSAIFVLDHLVPFYALHVEKSIADKISNFDALTGLYTRRYIMDKLKEEIERAERYSEALSVAMMDVDNFKNVNDTSGHDVGDEVMKEIARIVMENVRSIDVVGRYGGEEFLMVFPHTPLENAMKICERIRRRIESLRIYPTGITVSIGVTQLEGKGDSVDDMVKKADVALYDAKSRGKNKVVAFSQHGET